MTLCQKPELSCFIVQVSWLSSVSILYIFSGEKVDIYVMKDAPAGEWLLVATEVTDKTGRITYAFPEDNALGYGMYPIKMVVR